MTWQGAFMMIPINIGQFQIKYRSVAVELSVRNLPFLVKSIFWLRCGLSIGWVIITREDEPPHPPSLLQHSVAAQFNSKSSCRAHSITPVLLLVWIQGFSLLSLYKQRFFQLYSEGEFRIETLLDFVSFFYQLNIETLEVI